MSPGERRYGEELEPHRRELHAHCYRMLGSVQDAEDAVQETLLKAWRGREALRGPQLAALVAVLDRDKRLPADDRAPPGARAAARLRPGGRPAQPARARRWSSRSGSSRYPDVQLGLDAGLAGPEARYEQREAIELAFIAALQHLPARQRAVLILRDVLGYSGAEVADALQTTPASVYSLLQRAHASLDDRLPPRSQQSTLRSLGDARLRAIVDSYVEAWAHSDVDAIVSMLTESATLAMPPTPTWWRGRDAIAIGLPSPLSAAPRAGGWCRPRPTASRRWVLPPRSLGRLCPLRGQGADLRRGSHRRDHLVPRPVRSRALRATRAGMTAHRSERTHHAETRR